MKPSQLLEEFCEESEKFDQSFIRVERLKDAILQNLEPGLYQINPNTVVEVTKVDLYSTVLMRKTIKPPE